MAPSGHVPVSHQENWRDALSPHRSIATSILISDGYTPIYFFLSRWNFISRGNIISYWRIILRLLKMSKSLRFARSLLEMILLLVAAVSGIVVAACLIMTTGDFGGKCLLYGYVSKARPVDDRMKYWVSWKGVANCRFIIIVQVLASIFAFINFAVQGYFTLKRKIHGTSSVPLLFTALYTISWTFILVSSCILSAGFASYCKSWREVMSERDVTCRAVQRIEWIEGTSVNGHRFYDVLSVAQTATWISFCVWTILPLVAWAGVRFVSNRRHQEQASEVPT